MGWAWVILAILLAGLVAGQVAYIRTLGEMKGTRLAVAIRAANIALVLVAVGLAGWAAYVMLAAGRK